MSAYLSRSVCVILLVVLVIAPNPSVRSMADSSVKKSAVTAGPASSGTRVDKKENPAAKPTDPAKLEFFEKQVRPLLVKRCFKCHSNRGDEPKGGLRLDSLSAILEGGDTGPAMVQGKPELSLMIEAINYRGDYEMPPKSKMSDAEIAILTQWVKSGSVWPAGDSSATDLKKQAFDLSGRMASHWSWNKLKKRPVPSVKNTAWVRNYVDAYILSKLEGAKLSPALSADRRTLIRRVTFDLIGLPPAPAEVDAFVADRSPKAYEKVVDRLLKSPHFGEQFARHWLDLVRYGETRGHEFDNQAANAYQYRDYVIRAFNADVPYDQFVTEHLAGDLIENPRLHPSEGFNESVLGTGFWFLGEWMHSPVDLRKDETDRMDNQIDVMSKTFLGLTLACARCHDHKFDAITTTDYYAMMGYLQSSAYRQFRFDTNGPNGQIAKKLSALRTGAALPLSKAYADAMRPAVDNAARYLIAAGEVFRIGLANGQQQKLSEIAKRHNLDAARLSDWVKQLALARKDRHSPLHAWALFCEIKTGSEIKTGTQPDQRASVLSSLAKSYNVDFKRAAGAIPKDAEIIVDYSDSKPAQWIVDGHSFSTGPAKIGQLLLSDDPQNPVRGVVSRGMAKRDRAFVGLKLKPGTQNEPGRLGGWQRAGMTIGSPTFTLTSGMVHILVRGPGHLYCAVDSHRLNNGPLHGSFVREWKATSGGRAHWLTIDLRRYKGHNLHLEINPQGAEDLEIYKIIQSAKRPSIVEIPNRAIAKLVSAGAKLGLNELAAAYAGLFSKTLSDLHAGKLSSCDNAEMADWMIRHGNLFLPHDAKQTEILTALAQPILEQREKLINHIQRESRTAIAMWDTSGIDEHLLIRGNHATAGAVIPRRMITALGGKKQPPIKRGSGRRELAKQFTNPKNPYVSRVIVNRLWHHLFGRGIVASVDNFGVLGHRPTHLELLDALALDFIKKGWSIKKSIRTMVLSSTYRMTSKSGELAETADPENLLLHRMRVRRLTGEAIRDAILTVSGRLNRKMYGPSVAIHLTPFMQGRGRPGRSGPLDGDGRRSVYVEVRRNFLSPMMLAFDGPIPFSTVGRRTLSNVPAQALILMNDPMVIQQSRLWAENLLREKNLNMEQRINLLYETAYARPPDAEELRQATAFLRSQAELYGIGDVAEMSDGRPWADLCHVLLNVKEFIFIK